VGVGDLGVAIKFARAVSSRTALAVVPAVSFPTGDARRGLGAGRALASAIGVVSGVFWRLPWYSSPNGPSWTQAERWV